jgi:hypothetical protein
MISSNIIGIGAAIVIIGAGVVAYDPFPPANINYVKIETPSVAPGEEVHVSVGVAGKRACAGHAESILIDGAGLATSALNPADFVSGNSGNRIIKQVIPVTATPGPAELTRTATYTCNVLQQLLHWPIEQQIFRVQFTITPKEKS